MALWETSFFPIFMPKTKISCTRQGGRSVTRRARNSSMSNPPPPPGAEAIALLCSAMWGLCTCHIPGPKWECSWISHDTSNHTLHDIKNKEHWQNWSSYENASHSPNHLNMNGVHVQDSYKWRTGNGKLPRSAKHCFQQRSLVCRGKFLGFLQVMLHFLYYGRLFFRALQSLPLLPH